MSNQNISIEDPQTCFNTNQSNKSNENIYTYTKINRSELTRWSTTSRTSDFSPPAFDDSRCPLNFQHCDSLYVFFFACLSTCSVCIFILILVSPLLIQILNLLIPNYPHLIIICELPIDYSLLIQIQIYWFLIIPTYDTSYLLNPKDKQRLKNGQNCTIIAVMAS